MRLRRAILVVAVGITFGCGTENRPYRVVVTTDVVADLMRGIMGDDAEIQMLIPPATDPHSAALKPEHSKLLDQADLVVANGFDLEAKMLPELRKSGDRLVFACEKAVTGLYLIDSPPGMSVVEAIEDSQGRRDPHVYQDPDLWVQVGETMLKEIQERYPAKKGTWEKRFQKWKSAALDAGSYARRRLREVPPESRVLMTSHRGYAYFGRAFGWVVLVPDDLRKLPPEVEIVPMLVHPATDVAERTLTPKEARELNTPHFLGWPVLSTHSLFDHEGRPLSYPEWVRCNADLIWEYDSEYGSCFWKREEIPPEYTRPR